MASVPDRSPPDSAGVEESMNAKEIRDNCHKCGNRSLLLMKPALLPTDFCDHAQMECSKIVYCHESIRIPKKGKVQVKKAVKDV